MKGILLFLQFIFCTIYFAMSQSPLVKQWDYRFGGTDDDGLRTMIKTSDGGFLLGGLSSSGLNGDKTQDSWNSPLSDYWIVKVDELGNKQWDKVFGGTSADFLFSMEQTADGGFILGGISASAISGNRTQTTWGNYDYWIVKTDSLGNKQWDKDFGGTDVDWLLTVRQTPDGGFILSGSSRSGISGDKTQPCSGYSDYWIVKTDSAGNKLWDKVIGGNGNDQIGCLDLTSDGGFIIGGTSNSPISGDKTKPLWGMNDFWIVKTDSLCNILWDKDFGGTDEDLLVSLKQTNDGGFILGGNSLSGISGDKSEQGWGGIWWGDYWIVKTDSLGIKQWDKDYGGLSWENLYDIIQTSDSGFIITGDSESGISGNKTDYNLGGDQSWIVKTDKVGNKTWDRTLHTLTNSATGPTLEISNGCYLMSNLNGSLIGGDKSQDPRGGNDYWIIKFCDTMLTAIPEVNSSSASSIFIYPNPVENEFSVLTSSLTNEAIITIYNMLGEKIYSVGYHEMSTVDCSFLTSGIYYLEFVSGKKIFRTEFVKQ